MLLDPFGKQLCNIKRDRCVYVCVRACCVCVCDCDCVCVCVCVCVRAREWYLSRGLAVVQRMEAATHNDCNNNTAG